MKEKFVEGDLIIEAERAPGAPLRLVWHGRSVHRDPARVVGPFLEDAIGEAVSSSRAIDLAFEAMEYFNSSTITAVVDAIAEARVRGVRIVVTYDGARRWQELSLGALRVLERDDGLVEIRRL
jgi:hypothetical protein